MNNGSSITKGLLKVGNIIKNVIDGRPALDVDPDILVDGKITKLVASFIYSPNIVIDKNLQYMDSKTLTNIVKTNTLVFSGILIEAFRVMSEIYGVSPKMTVNKLASSNRDVISDIRRVEGLVTGKEEVDPISDILKSEGFLNITVGAERKGPSLRERELNGGAIDKISNNNAIQKDTAVAMTTYEVQLMVTDAKGNQRGIIIPVMVSPHIMFEDMEIFLNNMLDGDVEKTFLARLDEFRSGAISIMDLILATDLVRDYKDRKIKYKSNFASYLNAMDKTSSVKDVLHNRNSFSKRFNLYIMDVNMIPLVNKLVKGDIYKDSYKDEVLDKLMGFSMGYVDNEKETLLNMYDSIPGFTILDFKMLKKDKDSDVVDVVKEMMKNRQPF